ncbi:MFS transporter [Actinosynnema sp. NPDC047251]|uniref:Puromycin resistance protein n=1 Tax=Saccharothrix espanaensis (strain ATCC 51144 / DSM 44229 / JCM 9112 / NBRC 15066 / NRRL 15764) TaxID=1179773 RepID=K0KAJ9_SACES|nr:MFS transporter [Saccharothrix espanaensis]CCH33623.1 Puromycin resistance protein [Saccharothrix espanaensis DSM 44229]
MEDLRRWWALPVVGAAQLLVVLDGTIVNIALPTAQRALGMTDANRQWAITAYALAFGGLLLIGGRVGRALGHRRAFALGLAGFAAASALGGLAWNPPVLFAARALQGGFAAVLAPAGLSLLMIAFTEPKERGRALGVFAAVGAAGAAVGLIAGGLLTEYASWRWCLYVNVPVALMALAGTAFLPRDRARGGSLDLPGALLAAAAFAALVCGFTEAEGRGWGSPVVLGLLGLGVALVAAFVAVERRTADPVLPIRVLRDRARGGAFAAIALMFLAVFGFYLFMSYYLQAVLGYPPVEAGLVLVVNAAAAVVGSTLIAGRLHGRVAPVALIVPGLLVAAAGMLVLTRVTPESTDVLALHVLPALVLTGLGLGCVLPPTAALATTGGDLGAASAAYHASQQLGAALGTALLNTVAAAASGVGAPPAALVRGYTTALSVAAGILLAGALLVGLLLSRTDTVATKGKTS